MALALRGVPLQRWVQSKVSMDTPGQPAALDVGKCVMSRPPSQATSGDWKSAPCLHIHMGSRVSALLGGKCKCPIRSSTETGAGEIAEAASHPGGRWRHDLPMHAVDRVRLIMISSLLVSHVNRQGSMEWRHKVRWHCRAGERNRTSKTLFPSLEKQFSKSFKVQ